MPTKKAVQPKGMIASRDVFSLTEDVSPDEARALLKIAFSEAAHDRMRELSAKARAGTLSPREEEELSEFERLGCMLDVLHSLARRSIRKQRTAS